MTLLKNNTQRGRWAIALMWAYIAAEALAIVLDLFLAFSAAAIEEGGFDVMDNLALFDSLNAVHSFILLTILMAAGLAFVLWFRRAYYNMSVCYDFMSTSDVEAVYAWFIPFYNLYKPYQMMNELYVETADFLGKNFGQSTRLLSYDDTNVLDAGQTTMAFPGLTNKLIGYWWGVRISSGLFTYFSVLALGVPTSTEGLQTYAWVSTGTSLLTLVMCWLTLRVIGDYAKVEPLLSAQLEAQQQANAETPQGPPSPEVPDMA